MTPRAPVVPVAPVVLVDTGAAWIEGKVAQRAYPHIGLAYLAAALERAGHGVAIIDQAAAGLSGPETAARVLALRPHLLGITAVAFHAGEALELAASCRAADPGLRIVVGGAHASAVPHEFLAAPGVVDAVVRGEGEDAIVELAELTRLARRGARGCGDGGRVFRDGLTLVAGAVWRTEGGALARAPRRAWRLDLDELAPPNWGMYEYGRYVDITSPRFRQRIWLYPIAGSRGCPYRCSFCFPSQGRRFRPRPPANVVAEMGLNLDRHGARHFDFTDSNATLDRERFLALCREVVARGLDRELSWNFESRVDLVDPEVLGSARAAGAELWCFGAESGDDAVLARMGKGITVAAIERAVIWATAAGLRTKASFIIGHPYETRASLERTLDFARNLRATYGMDLYFNLIDPYPATPVHAMADRGRGGARWCPGQRDDWAVVLRSVPSLALGDLSAAELADAFERRVAVIRALPAHTYYQ